MIKILYLCAVLAVLVAHRVVQGGRILSRRNVKRQLDPTELMELQEQSEAELESTLPSGFSCGCYLNRYADLRRAFGNNCAKAKHHYIKHGRKERRNYKCSPKLPSARVGFQTLRGWNPVGDKCLTAAKRDCFAFNCTQRPMRVDACGGSSCPAGRET